MTADFDYDSLVTARPDGARRFEAGDRRHDLRRLHRRDRDGLRDLPGLATARVNYADRRLLARMARRSFDLRRRAERLRRMGYRAHPFELAEQRARGDRDLAAGCCVASPSPAFAAMNIMLLSVGVWVGGGPTSIAATRDLLSWRLRADRAAGGGLRRAALLQQRFRRAARAAASIWMCRSRSACCSRSPCRSMRRSPMPSTPISIRATMLLAFLLLGRLSRSRHAPQDARRRRQSRGACARRSPAASRRMARETLVPLADTRARRSRADAAGRAPAGRRRRRQRRVAASTRARHRRDRRRAVARGRSGLCRQHELRRRADDQRRGGAAARTLLDDIERLLEKATAMRARAMCVSPIASRGSMRRWCMSRRCRRRSFWLWRGASLHDALVTAIAVLIVTCPCALALAVPAVQVVASGALFRAGVLLNCADAIERLAEIDTIVFDKTGTLTAPEPRVVNAAQIDPASLELAARLAHSSSHPLARAVARGSVQCARRSTAREEQGSGVAAMVDGVEARLGSPRFCGSGARGCAARRARRRRVARRLSPCASKTRAVSMRQSSAQRRGRDRRRAESARFAIDNSLRRPRRGRGEDRRARSTSPTWPGALKPADKVARLDALRARGAQGADGRRRAQRRAGARRALCVDLADRRDADHAGGGRRRVPRRTPRAGRRRRSISPRKRAPADARESGAVGPLQCLRRAARHGGTG